MTQTEYLAWLEFYRLYPFDDLHRFHRPAAVIAASVRSGEIQPVLDYLAPDPRNATLSDADLVTMRTMGYTAKPGG